MTTVKEAVAVRFNEILRERDMRANKFANRSRMHSILIAFLHCLQQLVLTWE